jgi:hypothetical protein
VVVAAAQLRPTIAAMGCAEVAHARPGSRLDNLPPPSALAPPLPSGTIAPMNIALDIDGTITRRPAFFTILSRAIRLDGGKVFVVTSRSNSPDVERQTRRELRSWGVQFDRLVVIPDGDRGRICPLLLATRIPLLKAPRHPCSSSLRWARDVGTDRAFKLSMWRRGGA